MQELLTNIYHNNITSKPYVGSTRVIQPMQIIEVCYVYKLSENTFNRLRGTNLQLKVLPWGEHYALPLGNYLLYDRGPDGNAEVLIDMPRGAILVRSTSQIEAGGRIILKDARLPSE